MLLAIKSKLGREFLKASKEIEELKELKKLAKGELEAIKEVAMLGQSKSPCQNKPDLVNMVSTKNDCRCINDLLYE